jgi:hypothetical protein
LQEERKKKELEEKEKKKREIADKHAQASPAAPVGACTRVTRKSQTTGTGWRVCVPMRPCACVVTGRPSPPDVLWCTPSTTQLSRWP